MTPSLDVTQVPQPVPQSLERWPGLIRENTDFPKAIRRLCNDGARPRGRRAAEQGDELASFQLTELHSLPQPRFSQHSGLPRIKGFAAMRHFDQTDDRLGSNGTDAAKAAPLCMS